MLPLRLGPTHQERVGCAQFAHVEDPKMVQTILSHPKSLTAEVPHAQWHSLISNHFGESVSGPEKAGVGGSIPSLATN